MRAFDSVLQFFHAHVDVVEGVLQLLVGFVKGALDLLVGFPQRVFQAFMDLTHLGFVPFVQFGAQALDHLGVWLLALWAGSILELFCQVFHPGGAQVLNGQTQVHGLGYRAILAST